MFWGISGFFGLCVAGWLADKVGRRIAFVVTLIEGAIFMTLWVYTEDKLWLWIFGLAWSFGFLGFWGPSTTLTAEVFPTRIRGAAGPNQATPILAFTADAESAFDDRLQALGFDGAVAKPVEPHRLIAAILGAISSNETDDEAARGAA